VKRGDVDPSASELIEFHSDEIDEFLSMLEISTASLQDISAKGPANLALVSSYLTTQIEKPSHYPLELEEIQKLASMERSKPWLWPLKLALATELSMVPQPLSTLDDLLEEALSIITHPTHVEVMLTLKKLEKKSVHGKPVIEKLFPRINSGSSISLLNLLLSPYSRKSLETVFASDNSYSPTLEGSDSLEALKPSERLLTLLHWFNLNSTLVGERVHFGSGKLSQWLKTSSAPELGRGHQKTSHFSRLGEYIVNYFGKDLVIPKSLKAIPIEQPTNSCSSALGD
jgi:hypothetical protein